MSKSYSVDEIPEEAWTAFKRAVPRDVNLEDAIRAMICGEVLERSADDRGRVRLGPDYAEKELIVVVVGEEWD